MNVIFSLLDSPAFGGAEQYLFSHLLYLNKKGFAVFLATNNLKVKEELSSRLNKLNHKNKENFILADAPYLLDAIGNWKGLIKFFISLPKALFWCYKTLKFLKNSYENVICFWVGFCDRLVFTPIVKFFSTSVIWVEIGPLEPTFKKNWGFPKWLYSKTECYVDKMITTSLFTKKSLLKNTHFQNKDIELVYPATKIYSKSQILEFKKQAKIWKEKMKIANFKILVVVARLATENEINNVIEALKYCDESYKLVIVGDGPERKNLEKQAESLALKNKVFFLGFVTEKQKQIVLSAADLFIFPRAWELDGFGMTTIEAMALGLPVLTTDFGPQKEIVSDHIEGFRYKPHDTIDLAKKIKKIFALDKDKLKKVSENGLKKVNDFSEQKANEKVLKIIQLFYD